MAVKVLLSKMTSDGEQMNIEYTLERSDYDRMKSRVVGDQANATSAIIPGDTLRQILAPYFHLLDERQYEFNQRIMASGYYQKKLAKLSPEAYQLVIEVWDIMHGRKPGPAMEQVIEQDRLETQQKVEELKAKQATENKLGPTPSPVESSDLGDLVEENVPEPEGA